MTTQTALLLILAAQRAPAQDQGRAMQVICRINAHVRKQGGLPRLRQCAAMVWPDRLDMQGRAQLVGRT